MESHHRHWDTTVLRLNAAWKQEKIAGLSLGEIRLQVEMMFPGDVTAKAIDTQASP